MAKGKYFIFLHQDDFLDSYAIEKLIAPLESDCNLVFSFCNHYMIDESGAIDYFMTDRLDTIYKRDKLYYGFINDFCKVALVWQSVCLSGSCLFRASAADFSVVPESASSALNLWFFYIICKTGKHGFYNDEKLGYSRFHKDSLTNKNGIGLCKGMLFCYSNFSKDPYLAKYSFFFRKQAAACRIHIAKLLILMDKTDEARRCICSGFSFFNFKNYFLLLCSFLPGRLRKSILISAGDVKNFIKGIQK
jgi:hypothetical protein